MFRRVHPLVVLVAVGILFWAVLGALLISWGL